MSNSLRPHGLQHTRFPCPSPSPGVCSNSCPLNWWCHPTISFSVIPFSSCLQSFTELVYFQMSQLFASGGHSLLARTNHRDQPDCKRGYRMQGSKGWVPDYLLSANFSACEELAHWKRSWSGKDWKQEEKGATEEEMVRWHHWLDGHKFEQALGVDDGQGNLECCSPWGHKESDVTWRLNNNFSATQHGPPSQQGSCLFHSKHCPSIGKQSNM